MLTAALIALKSTQFSCIATSFESWWRKHRVLESFQQDVSRVTAKIPRLVPGGTSLSPPAAPLQREDRAYNSTEHVDKAIRSLDGAFPLLLVLPRGSHPGTGTTLSPARGAGLSTGGQLYHFRFSCYAT